MKLVSRYLLFLVAGAVFGVAATTVRAVHAERDEPGRDLPIEDLKIFSEIYGKIKSDYVEQVSDRDLLNDAIQGMLAGLDPHSTYLDPESFGEVNISTQGKFGGLGIEVTMEDGFVKVVAPIDGTPAHRAGLQPGDLIIRLDDTPVKGMALNDAVKLMRGEPGTDIQLTIVRNGRAKPFDVTLTRAVIEIASVRSELLEDAYGYVRITQFQSSTAEGLREELSDLKKEAGGGLKGLILDLRNNPGGVLDGAVAVTDTFLRKGTIVYTRGRSEESRISFNATPVDFADGAPIVVLVNGGSASASEIVAGALQDHQRAVIMGTKTFGKGSVQTILPMQNGAALKLTTARYYTPNDRTIQAVGIEPDIVSTNLAFSDEKDEPEGQLRESNLAGHLRNENGSEGADAGDNDVELSLPDRDYQVREALNLLKGVNIAQNRST